MALAIKTLTEDTNISRLAAANDVSRKYLYQQKDKARDALQEVFAPSEVLLSISVTNAWLDQLVVSLTLTCHSSYRGGCNLFNLFATCWACPSVLAPYTICSSALPRVSLELNVAQELSAIRVGLNDEIFHCNDPMLVGVDAHSTYCYLLSSEPHRDGDAWGTHLLCLGDQGLDPEYFSDSTLFTGYSAQPQPAVSCSLATLDNDEA